jgi:endonuclease/exonuclease/phosphatase family metal-dependent hydrolase
VVLETAQIDNMNEEASTINATAGHTRQKIWMATGWIVVGWFVLVVLLGGVVRAPSAPLVVAVAFLPWLWATGMLVLSLGWLVTGKIRNAIWAPLLLFFLGTIFFGPTVFGSFSSPEGDLVVMEYNIQRLWGGEDPSMAASCINGEIDRVSPDILVLLEVERRQIQQLSDQYSGNCEHTNYFGSDHAGIGGIAVCTRRDANLMISRVEESHYTDGDAWRYLFVELSDGYGQLNVIAVHLYPYRVTDRHKPSRIADEVASVANTQGAQSVALLERVGKLKDPTIIAGDFNTTSEFSLHTRLRKSLRDAWRDAGWGFGATTVFHDILPLRVDFLYTTPDIDAVGASVGSAVCADHRPVIAQLDLL